MRIGNLAARYQWQLPLPKSYWGKDLLLNSLPWLLVGSSPARAVAWMAHSVPCHLSIYKTVRNTAHFLSIKSSKWEGQRQGHRWTPCLPVLESLTATVLHSSSQSSTHSREENTWTWVPRDGEPQYKLSFIFIPPGQDSHCMTPYSVFKVTLKLPSILEKGWNFCI